MPRYTYPEYLEFAASKCGIPGERFLDIIRGEAAATSAEEQRIREHYADLGYDLTAIREAALFSDVPAHMRYEMLRENLMFLLRTIPRGGNGDFVKSVDIDPSTLSRWKKGITLPDKYHLRLICEYFHLPEAALRTGYIFLGVEPATIQSKKELCKEWIDRMPPEDFEALYPAIKKLIK